MEKDVRVYTYNAHTYVYAFVIHNRILPNHKRKEIVPFAATLMDLKIIVLSKVSQKMNST